MNHILKITVFALTAVIACAFTPGASRGEGVEDAVQARAEARVKAIALNIENAAGRKARITVVQDIGKEACVLPDGTIVITSGLLASCGSDSEVAFVVAHELSHFIAKDHAKAPAPSLVNSGVRAFNETESELKADRTAVDFSRRAGYDPAAGHDLLTRLSKDGGQESEVTRALLGRRIDALKTHLKTIED